VQHDIERRSTDPHVKPEATIAPAVIPDLMETERDPHGCAECTAKFESSADLKNHTRALHIKRLDFACHKCGTFFGNGFSLRRHLASVHNVEPDSADLAEESKFIVVKNANNRSPCGEEQKHACKECGERFGNGFTLRIHAKMEHEKQPI